MKMKFAALAILSFALLPLAAQADVPGRHPAYLHALTDLRDARWMLEHRGGDAAVRANEDVAIVEIDRAIGETKSAAGDDGKNLSDKPHEDAKLDRPGRLHHAMELLKKARNDINKEEDNVEARHVQVRALQHIDEAIRATGRAIGDVEHGR
jgi:hypothetical protein